MPDYSFKNMRKLNCAGGSSAFLLAAATPAADTQPSDAAPPQRVGIRYLDAANAASLRPIANGLRRCGINVTEHRVPFAGVRRKGVALIVDELCFPIRLPRRAMRHCAGACAAPLQNRVGDGRRAAGAARYWARAQPLPHTTRRRPVAVPNDARCCRQ
jgi:hypothetical protein